MEEIEETKDEGWHEIPDWLEIPELELNRKFYFPKIVKRPQGLRDTDQVEFQIRPGQELTQKMKFKKYLKYLGIRPQDWKKYFDWEIGKDRMTSGILKEEALRFLKLLPEIWKKQLIERKKYVENLIEKKKQFRSAEREEIRETIEKVFVQLLNESGYFEEAWLTDPINDIIEKTDVIAKLEKTNENELDQYLAIQFTVSMDPVDIERKRKEIIERGKITLPEHLELGEMPIVFIKDNQRNYTEVVETDEGIKKIPLIEYYKEQIKTKPEAMLWKFFKNHINRMIDNWFDQIMVSLGEEASKHPADRDFYLNYLEKIRKLAEEHKKYL